MTVASRYVNEVHTGQNYLATWIPSLELELGSIGVLNHERIFVPQIDASTVGIEFDTTKSPSEFEFESQSATDFAMHFKAAGETSELTPHIPQGSAGIGMRFNAGGAHYLRMDGATHERIGDQITLARSILHLARTGAWDKDWVIVTERINASSCMVFVSESSNGSAELSLDAEIAALGLQALSAGTGISLTHYHSMNTRIVGQGGLTPLFRGVRIKRPWFVGPRKVSPAYADKLSELVEDADSDVELAVEKLTTQSELDEASA